LLDTNTGEKLEWTQIECGANHTVGIAKNGEVLAWGENVWGQLGDGLKKSRIVPTKVAGLDGIVITKISCGSLHTAALTDKGDLLTWYVRS
jgi:alpha-tubulin suppressor-like RCC1 family protein